MKHLFTLVGCLVLLAGTGWAADPTKPNIIVIMTDDMGFSDIGCYGGEIQTPNLDRLAVSGMKFSQFYNCSKCEPSRAALVTGHQWYDYDAKVDVRKETPTFGEVVRAAGYRTMMVGKWHCAGSPFTRGFDRHFGFMGGGTDYFQGDKTFTLDGKPWPVPTQGFYATSILSTHAVQFIRDERQAHPNKPFFLYVGFNAPHAPLQALPEDVAKYRGKYLKGWDVIRQERYAKQQALGLAGLGWRFPERPATIPAWDTLSDQEKAFEDLRMATYAAMVDRVDYGVGAIVKTLEELTIRDNTLIVFLNDNGASPNDRGRKGGLGMPGSKWNVGLAWAQVSNTPFKFYKRTQNSGGVTTPCIANWPAVIKPQPVYNDQPCHIADILPTLIELAGGNYPQHFGGKRLPPLPGRSFASILTNNAVLPPRTIYFSLFSNMAVVDNGWRLVTAYGQPWQLFDLTHDRTETTDVARTNPEQFQRMLALQKAFSVRDDVRQRLLAGEREPSYARIYREDGTIGPGANEDLVNPALNLALVKEMAKGLQPSPEEIEVLRRKNLRVKMPKKADEGDIATE